MLRQKILDGAGDLFGSRGFDDVSIDEIALRVGVGKGSIYRQFPSKEELYASVVIEGFIALRTEIHQALKDVAARREQIRTIVSRIMSYFWNRRQFFVFLRDPTKLPRAMEKRYRAEREQLSTMIGRILAEGMRLGEIRGDLDSNLMTQSLLGMMRGIQRYRPHNLRLEDAISTVAALFLDGATRQRSQAGCDEAAVIPVPVERARARVRPRS